MLVKLMMNLKLTQGLFLSPFRDIHIFPVIGAHMIIAEMKKKYWFQKLLFITNISKFVFFEFRCFESFYSHSSNDWRYSMFSNISRIFVYVTALSHAYLSDRIFIKKIERAKPATFWPPIMRYRGEQKLIIIFDDIARIARGDKRRWNLISPPCDVYASLFTIIIIERKFID